jgi:MFS family permease
VPAGLYGNELSLRLGLRATAMGVFLVSVLANALFGFAALLPYSAVVALAMVAGFVVQGNFSNLTSGVLVVAEPRWRGVTVAVYSCVGFAGGFLGTLLFGVALDRFGGTARLAAWVGGIQHLRDGVPGRQHRNGIPVARSGVGGRAGVKWCASAR